MRKLSVLICVPLLALAGCYSLERLADDGRVMIQKPFRAALSADPVSFEVHALCGRGMTAPSHRPAEVHLTASSGNYFLWPGAPALFQMRNATIQPNGGFGPFTPGATATSVTYVWRPAVSGVYDFRAVFPATSRTAEYITEPIRYVVPLEVSIKLEQAGPRRVAVTVDARTNSGAPTTFDFAICARRPDGMPGDDTWGPQSPDPNYTFTLPGSGQWVFYAVVNAYQNQGTAFAAFGEQIRVFAVQ